jgi:hypothetical protein
MFETGTEIHELQALMDRSHARLGTHAAAILTPARRLTARQVVNYLTGTKHIVVGTVTAGGEPRVGAVDGHFIHGRFWFGTGRSALRFQHLLRNPAVSACHLAGDDLGIVVHGRVTRRGGGRTSGGVDGARLRTSVCCQMPRLARLIVPSTCCW